MKLQISKPTMKSILLGAYILGVLAFSAASRASVNNYPLPIKLPPHVQIFQLAGTISLDANTGRAYLTNNGVVVAALEVPANVNLSLVPFHGQSVRLIGAYGNYRVQPVTAAIGSEVTDDQTQREVAPPTVFVLKIFGSSN